MMESFRKDCKESRYEAFIKDYLPSVKIKASCAFSMGSGAVFGTENLNSKFFSSSTFNFTMDVNIKRIYTSLYFNGAWPRLKEPFTVITGTNIFDFSNNEQFSFMDAGLRAGYFIARTGRFHLAPFISASGSTLKSNRFEGTEEKREYKIFNAFACGNGIHTEIKITDIKSKYPNPYGLDLTYLSFKIDAGYNVITKFKNSTFKGNIPWVTAAVTLGIGYF